MAPKSTPLEKAARMLDLVPYIYSHQGCSITELADEFSITESELLDDLTSLWMCGESKFDYMDLDFESGYVFIRNAETLNRIRSLSHQERISLLLGLSILEEELVDSGKDFKDDIDSLREKLGDDISRIIVAKPDIRSEILKGIESAIANRRTLEISYHSIIEDSVDDRVIHPLELFSEEKYWYLVAFCEKANSHRTFRLDRIQRLRPLEAPAIARDIPVNDSQIKIRARIHRDARTNTEALGSSLAIGGDEVVTSIYNQSWLARMVCASGGGIEVTDPARIRDDVLSIARSIRALYG